MQSVRHPVTGEHRAESGNRQGAANVFRDKATRLRRRAEACDLIAQMIDQKKLSGDEDELLWYLACEIETKH